jgi:6-phosphogluconate dehydrogenase
MAAFGEIDSAAPMRARAANDAETRRATTMFTSIADVSWFRAVAALSFMVAISPRGARHPHCRLFGARPIPAKTRTIIAAIEEGVETDVLSAALFARFRSRKDHTMAEKVCSAMRFQFGGHLERAAGG